MIKIKLHKLIALVSIMFTTSRIGISGLILNLRAMIHYSQEDLVVIEFTGQGLSTRKVSKSEALAEDF